MVQTVHKDNADDLKKVAKGAGITFAGSFVGRGLWFVTQVVVARSFGAEVFGLFILGFTVLKVSELLARFGLNTGAMKFVSIYRKNNPEKVKGVLLGAAGLSFSIGILVAAIVFFFSGVIAVSIFNNPELQKIIKVFATCVPFMSAMMVVASASQGFHTAKYFVYTNEFIQPFINLSLTVVAVIFELGILAVLAAFTFSYIVALAAGIYFIAKQFPGLVDSRLKPVFVFKELISYSVPLVFTGFLIFCIQWSDLLMLGAMDSVLSVGVYRAASQIPVFLGLILSAFNSIYAPVIAEMHHNGLNERLEAMFKATARWVFFFSLPAAIMIVFSTREIMGIFGAEFTGHGALVLIVLTAAQVVNCAAGGVGYTLIMTGRQKLEMVNSLVLIFLNIALNYTLIPSYGPLGAAIATGISIVAINLIRVAEILVILKIHPLSWNQLTTILCGLVAAIILYLTGNYLIGLAWLPSLAIKTTIIVAVFATITLLIGVRSDDKMILAVMLQKLPAAFRPSWICAVRSSEK